MAEKLLVKNSKAYFDYEILERYEAGMVLTGAEVKSVKMGRANLKGGFISLRTGAPYIKNLHISAYQPGNQPDYDPTHERKLLLTKKEINQLIGTAEQKGLAIIPLEIFLKSGLIKIRIGLGKGRKKYDKRNVLKKRQQDRDIQRALHT